GGVLDRVAADGYGGAQVRTGGVLGAHGLSPLSGGPAPCGARPSPGRSPPRGCGPASDSVAPGAPHGGLAADPHGRPGRVVAGGDLVRRVVAGEPSTPVHRVVDCPGAVRLDGREDRLGGLLVLVVARGYLVDEGLRPRAQVIPPVLPVGGAPLGV